MKKSIPDDAKQVFTGKLFNVYQWEQEMFDDSTAIFEALERDDSALIIPVQGNKIYYAKEEQPARAPFTSVFGGKVDKGEKPGEKIEVRETSIENFFQVAMQEDFRNLEIKIAAMEMELGVKDKQEFIKLLKGEK
jgi:hypothetical protein